LRLSKNASNGKKCSGKAGKLEKRRGKERRNEIHLKTIRMVAMGRRKKIFGSL